MSKISTLSREKALIERTLNEGFVQLRFPEPLEESYRVHRHALLVPRSVTVGWYAIAIYLAYCFSDYLLLPESVHFKTIAIRLFVLVPYIGLLIWLSRYTWRPSSYVLFYLSAYLVGGLSVIAIILVGRLQNVPIPYEGFLLIMLFGYFVTGLPFYSMVSASLLLFLCYVLAEWYAGYPAEALVFNSFFMVTANVIGAVGNYIQERTQRSNYLNKCLVELSRDQAEDRSESKTMLLATASHDLRQPLHAMNLFTENLLESLPKGQSRATAEKLNLSIQHLNRLLSALLDYSRLHAGVVDPRLDSIDIVDLIRQVKGAAEQDPEAPKVTFSVQAQEESGEQCFVRSDGILLARVVRNIVDNVIEHAKAQQLWIELEVGARSVKLSIIDDGVGMTPQEMDSMYKEFYQGEGDTGKGMGLGLAIVKQTVDLLGMPITVDSSKGKGTRFTLKIPRSLSHSPVVDNDLLVNDLSGKRVLIVEDIPEILESTTDMFQSWSCYTISASSVSDAIERSSGMQLDLVVTDYHLGKHENGLELLDQLRARSPRLPAIVITADIHLQLEDNDITIIAHKPVRPAKFRMMASQLLGSQE